MRRRYGTTRTETFAKAGMILLGLAAIIILLRGIWWALEDFTWYWALISVLSFLGLIFLTVYFVLWFIREIDRKV